MKFDKLILVADVAKALGWSTDRTRRWLFKVGAIEKRGPKLWVTTREKLMDAFPEAYREVVLEGDLYEDDDS